MAHTGVKGAAFPQLGAAQAPHDWSAILGSGDWVFDASSNSLFNKSSGKTIPMAIALELAAVSTMANVFPSGLGHAQDAQAMAQARVQDPRIESSDDRLQMIVWRLRKRRIGLDQIHTTLAGDKVHFTCIANGEFIHLEDDSALFPSDAFIAALRLLIP